MGADVTITAENIANISEKLDKLSGDLSAEEQGLLLAVFQAASNDINGDVSGFAQLTGGLGLGGGFVGIFGGVLDPNGGTGVGVGVGGSGGSGGVGVGVTPTGQAAALVSIPGVGGGMFLVGGA